MDTYTEMDRLNELLDKHQREVCMFLLGITYATGKKPAYEQIPQVAEYLRKNDLITVAPLTTQECENIVREAMLAVNRAVV